MEGLPLFENPFTVSRIFSTQEALPTANVPGLATPQVVTTGVLPNNMQNTLAKIQTVDDFIKP